MDAEYFAFIASCNENDKPGYCEDDVAFDPCCVNGCPCLSLEFLDDAIIITPDNA